MSSGTRDRGSNKIGRGEVRACFSASEFAISRVIHLLGPGLISGGRRLAIHNRLGYEPQTTQSDDGE